MEWQSTYWDEVWMWYAEFKNFSYVFNTGGDPWFSYNTHVWTIPLEYKGSLVIFTSLLAFSRMARIARLWCEFGLILYFLYVADGWSCALFSSGMLLCDLDQLSERNELPLVFRLLENYKELIFYNLFFLGIFLGGVPSFSNDMKEFKKSPGWYLLSSLKPQAVYNYKAFYLFWAATFIVPSIPRISWLKEFFELRFNQYLGRISYALYLVHGPILLILGDRVYSSVGWVREAHKIAIPHWINLFPLPKFGPLGMEFAFLVPHLVLLPFTFWVAEVVTKVVDEPTVKFARWAYGITLAPAVKL
jgi:peptidoglycan/LPS O-acetylase OafA/YrhL